MAKMISLKRPAAKGKDEQPAVMGGEDGVALHLEHHHLEKLGLGGKLKAGHKVEFQGRGHVESAHSTSTEDGERHSATIRLHHGSMEHEGDQDGEREEIRSELMRNHEKQESKAHEKAERKAAKAGKLTD